MRLSRPRRGFTLMELMLVIAVLLILAAVTLPSMAGIQGNVRQKAAADTVRGRIADGRARAMEHAAAYRLAVHQDGTRLRLAADASDFADSSDATEDTLEKATVAVLPDAATGEPPADSSGWVTVATFLPDGTCREDSVILAVHEATFPALRIHLRGVTGGSRVLPTDTSGGAK